jgi:hypothetical protein
MGVWEFCVPAGCIPVLTTDRRDSCQASVHDALLYLDNELFINETVVASAETERFARFVRAVIRSNECHRATRGIAVSVHAPVGVLGSPRAYKSRVEARS